MDSKDDKAARLAAALRANLRRRKAQARGGEDAGAGAGAVASTNGEDAADAEGGAGGTIRDR